MREDISRKKVQEEQEKRRLAAKQEVRDKTIVNLEQNQKVETAVAESAVEEVIIRKEVHSIQ
jgi:hypothetical protein